MEIRLSDLAQPELLKSETTQAGIILAGGSQTDPTVTAVLAPSPIGLGGE